MNSDPIDAAIVQAVAAKYERDGGQKTEDFLRAVLAEVTAGKLMAMAMPPMLSPKDSGRVITAYNNVVTSPARVGSPEREALKRDLEEALRVPVAVVKAEAERERARRAEADRVANLAKQAGKL